MTRQQNRRRRILTAIAGIAVAGLALTACSSGGSGESDGDVKLTFRTWDTNAQAAYEESFATFTKEHPNITVDVEVVPWADYFTKLRTDIAGDSAADLFWINASSYAPYAEAGALSDISEVYGDDFEAAAQEWAPSVVEQFTHDGTLFALPQTSDGGIAVYYNADLLAKAGVTPEEVSKLQWAPGGGSDDTLIPTLQKLTLDASGKTAAESGFDAQNVAQYGYNAAADLQAIYLPFIGSNGGTFQDGEKFTFSDPKTVEAFQYLVDLINEHHVAPDAADTNTNGDFSRDQFLQGKMALFQSGLYNLANVADNADFEWGVAMMPAGPEGAVSVTNGVAVAGNAKSEHQDAVNEVLRWLGTTEGNSPIGSTGANLPAVVGAQDAYREFWAGRDVELEPFFKVLESGKTIPAPVGANFNSASEAFGPILSEIFLGQLPVEKGLQQADKAANAAIG